jgi:hypothetical protein
MAGQYNMWRGEPSGFEEIDARGVGWQPGGWGHHPDPPDQRGGWAPYGDHIRERSYYDSAQRRPQAERIWDEVREAEQQTGTGRERARTGNLLQQYQQTGGRWGDRQLANELAREGWGRSNTDRAPRNTRPDTTIRGPNTDRDKSTTPADAARNAETKKEEREKWAVLSMMEGGQRLMEEFQCIICMEMMHKPCLSMMCTHRFCEECILEWIRIKPTCPECRCRLTEDKLRYDRNIKNIMEKVVLLRWPGQPTPRE